MFARKFIAFGFLFGMLLASHLPAQDATTTTWFVVRHADRDGDNDALTKAGEQRAEQLRDLMKLFQVNAVYSTNTVRTKNTAAPTAAELNLPVTEYDGKPGKGWFEMIKSKHAGGAVLIVGHSNTCGEIVRGLGGQGDFTLGENDYDNLFVVTAGKSDTRAIRIKFGSRSAKD